MNITIVGLPYHLLKQFIKVGDMVVLKPEPDNKFSKTAVAVYWNHNMIGHVSKEQSSEALHIMRNGNVAELQAIIEKINATCIKATVIKPYYTTELKGGFIRDHLYQGAVFKTISKKEEPNMLNKFVNLNKMIATNAAYLEAGRVATNQLAKVAASKAPLMIRGYADTPAGKLVIANIFAVAVDQYRPGNQPLMKLGNAMMTSAYQEFIASFNIDQMLEEFLGSDKIKAAMEKIEKSALEPEA